MTQSMRASQFILTYGPGSILEGQEGPRIIPSANIGLFTQNSRFNIADYRIDDDRMSKGLLNGQGIFRLPSNAEVGMQSSEFLYRTKPFPTWKLCLNQINHPSQSYLLYRGPKCPLCLDVINRQFKEAIRFVIACPNGHLDEVPWASIAHGGDKCDSSNIENIHSELRRSGSFLWHRSGGTLSSIRIECPRCGMNGGFGPAYYGSRKCSGRFPEREELLSPPSRPWNCRRNAKIIQRQATNLRIPEIRTLLSIKQVLTKTHEMLQNTAIGSAVVVNPPDSLDKFKEILQRLVTGGFISQNIFDGILIDADWNELKKILDDMMKPPTTSYHGLIMDEFKELNIASINGAPPLRSSRPHSNIIFEVNPNFIRNVKARNGTNMRISPIQKLRTVTVQAGYRRELPDSEDDPDPSKLVTVLFDAQNTIWHPGVQFLGEGLFIKIENEKIFQNISGTHAKKWINALEHSDEYPNYVFRDKDHSRDEIHPGFVWLHTFAHLIIRTISEEAGYSSASIRERIYFERIGNTAHGGILIYATQPGSEGTMGGLIAMAQNFENILEGVYEQLETCSGDPLCRENEMKDHGYIGASCYGCTMNSETSCEHRNMWLDRNIMLENMP